MQNLNTLEFENAVTIEDMALVIQRTGMVMRIAAEIDRYICELGNEGRLLSMQLNEVLDNTESDGRLVIEDYRNIYENRPIEEILKQIRQLNYDELADISRVYRIMGHHSTNPNETIIEPRGYRVMNKVPKVPVAIARKVADAFSSLQSILKASIEDLDEVEGIGSVRARVIKDGLRRLQEQVRLSSFK
jgi:diadenylate cyclase